MLRIYTKQTAGRQSLRENGVPPDHLIVLYGPLDCQIFPNEPHSLPCPRNGSIEKVALQ